MIRLRTLSLLIPFLLLGCDKPNEPVEPVAITVPAPAPAPAVVAPAPPPPPMSTDATTAAQAVLMPTQDRTAGGELSLTPETGMLRLTGRLSGLTPGATHAFHIHEIGDCSHPAAESAGPHFNPAGQPHGNRDTGPHHAGDMPNVVADALGQAEVNLTLADLELGTNGPRDVLGRAIIVHEQADDYSSQPAGNAGARIACGVIGRTASAGMAPATGMSMDTAPATGTLPGEPVPAAPPLDGTEPATGPATTPDSASPAPSDDNGPV